MALLRVLDRIVQLSNAPSRPERAVFQVVVVMTWSLGNVKIKEEYHRDKAPTAVILNARFHWRPVV
jgi:hypothetical protein